MTTSAVAPYPLYWPLDQARTTSRREAAFKTGLGRARDHLLRQLKLLSASDVVLSSNLALRRDGLPYADAAQPSDPGVAVYFTRRGPWSRERLRYESKPYVIACDTFRKVEWNLHAVGLTVEALRAIQRYGATQMLEQAFSGFAALPPKANVRHWREVLGIPRTSSLSPDETREAVRKAYRELAGIHHPDVGGDTERMAEINRAFEDAKADGLA